MKLTYSEVIDKIMNTHRFGNLTGYDVSKRMLEQLGNPQSGIPFVHIAGTNGKGSTTAFLCKILEQTGKKAGMFTSPHLIDFEERIRINGEYISKEDVTRLGNLLLEMKFDVSPTMFDYCLVMAVLYFKEQQCDMMVMETGIGGKYDSTNALGVPEAAVLTKIGFDHMAILGDTLEKIAKEKAGIIKKGSYVVTQLQQPEAERVIFQKFQETGQTMDRYQIVTKDDISYAKMIPKKMQGLFQQENAATAIRAARIILKKWNVENAEEMIQKGIRETVWKGRMELVNEHPFFMIDGAHNSNGVHALAESLKELYPEEKFHFIMGVMADKDYEEMIEELLPLALDFIAVTPESTRALQCKDLAECIQKKGIAAQYSEQMEDVIAPLLPRTADRKMEYHKKAWKEKSKAKTVAFGSLYFIGEIESLMK